MSFSKNILAFAKKKPLIFNCFIYGSFYTSAEFLQQTYKQRERRNAISTSKPLTVTENASPLVVIGSQRNSEADTSQLNGTRFKATADDGYDWQVLQRYIVYGYFLAGPILHGWYLWLDKFYIGTAAGTVMKKLLCDQFILTPPLLVLFFSSMSLMEGQTDILGECQAKFWKTFLTSCLYWLPVQFVNFMVVPATLRVTFVSVAAFLWVNILCHLKRTPVANDEQ